MPECKQPACCLLGEHGPAPLLDQLDEPVRRVEAELHGESLGEHTFDDKPIPMTKHGIDCSGLVHMSYRRLRRRLVPRDADQQEVAGKLLRKPVSY